LRLYTNWEQVYAAVDAEGWCRPGFSDFTRAESKVALKPDSIARYRNDIFLPGTLQCDSYINAQCLGSGVIDSFWNQENRRLRLSRQVLLQNVHQQFLVDEAVLTNPPGRWPHPLRPQIKDTIQRLKDDMAGKNLLDFRVVPDDIAIGFDEHVYKGTFSLFEVEGEVNGFTENGWPSCWLERAEGDQLEQLKSTWNTIGATALDRKESIEILEQTLGKLHI
jgi:hypothetical protein